MTRFTARKKSDATVHASPERVWTALTDPELLPRLTPYLERIDVSDEGRTWTWHLKRIPVLGGSVASSFTEQMSFEEPSRIGYRPHPDEPEQKTLVTGDYHLQERPDGTNVSIDITVDIELPFPRIARSGVEAGMATVMAGMGVAFSRNLVRHLGGA